MRRTTLQLACSLLLGAALAAAGGVVETNSAGPPLPPPHGYQCVTANVTLHHLSPVEYFRGLLGMTPAERERVLAGKPVADRTALLSKLREYEAMPREAREQRLLQTEIHWNLLALMRLAPSERQARMKDVSPLYQPMILAQLAQWDELPAPTRQELLGKESFLRAYLEWQDHPPTPPGAGLSMLSAEQRARWTEELKWWQGLPESRHAELCGQFRRWFYLTGKEQSEAIQPLSEAERRQMETALEDYANLPPALRRQCVESFGKFASMAPEERNQFLQNAAKWEAMTPLEREKWRRLVNVLPPMPPGYHLHPPPPMPPGFRWPPAPASRATNQPAATNLAQSTNRGP